MSAISKVLLPLEMGVKIEVRTSVCLVSGCLTTALCKKS